MRVPGLAAARDERLILLAIGLLGAAWGLAVAAGGLTSFFLCASLIACGVILFDFRVGVVLLILLMPMSGSSRIDRKSTRLNSSHSQISYAVFCLKKKTR